MLYTLKEHFLLIAIWVCAIALSIVSYIGLQNVIPSFGDILLAHTLYMPIALPNGFFHIVGVYVDYSAHRDFFFFVLAAGYWVPIGAALYWYLEEREHKYVWVMALLVLPGAVKWLYFAEAMMHS